MDAHTAESNESCGCLTANCYLLRIDATMVSDYYRLRGGAGHLRTTPFQTHASRRFQPSAHRTPANACPRPEDDFRHRQLFGRGLVQCSCALASGHAEPNGCKTSQVSASLQLQSG